MAEAGFHSFFPGTNPCNVHLYLPIFEFDHKAHLGCLLLYTQTGYQGVLTVLGTNGNTSTDVLQAHVLQCN